jgi:hypothetical protein
MFYLKSFLLLSTFFLSTFDSDCDCVLEPIEKHIENSEFIFTGKVVENLDTIQEINLAVVNPNIGYTAIVKPCKIFKGNITEITEVEFGSDYSNCALKFEKEKDYLFFAYKKDNKFFIYPCSYTEKASSSKKNIRFIKKHIRNGN